MFGIISCGKCFTDIALIAENGAKAFFLALFQLSGDKLKNRGYRLFAIRAPLSEEYRHGGQA